MRKIERSFLVLLLIVALVGVVYAAGAGRPERTDVRPIYTLVEPSDAALAIDWDFTGTDTTTIADMTTAIAAAKIIHGRHTVYCCARMDGATDSVKITPIFRAADGSVVRVGDSETLAVADAGALVDNNGYYLTPTAYWETCGEYDVIFHVSVQAGTFHELWVGTR